MLILLDTEGGEVAVMDDDPPQDGVIDLDDGRVFMLEDVIENDWYYREQLQ